MMFRDECITEEGGLIIVLIAEPLDLKKSPLENSLNQKNKKSRDKQEVIFLEMEYTHKSIEDFLIKLDVSHTDTLTIDDLLRFSKQVDLQISDNVSSCSNINRRL